MDHMVVYCTIIVPKTHIFEPEMRLENRFEQGAMNWFRPSLRKGMVVGVWKHIGDGPLKLTLFLGLLILPASGAFASCIKWSDAKAVIAKNNLLKPAEVRRRAIRGGGEVVSMNLCRKGGGYVYRLTVIGRKKRVRDVEIDAHSGRNHRAGATGKRRSRRRGGKLENQIINRVKRNLRRYGIKYY